MSRSVIVTRKPLSFLQSCCLVEDCTKVRLRIHLEKGRKGPHTAWPADGMLRSGMTAPADLSEL